MDTRDKARGVRGTNRCWVRKGEGEMGEGGVGVLCTYFKPKDVIHLQP